MILTLIRIIQIASWLLVMAIIANTILSYFMSPWHPVRKFLYRIIEPLLRPIRRILPTVAMIDFSPIVLIILIQIIEYVLISLLAAAG